MKRSQDVFFFTLIDLLLQLLFVAVVVWVIDRATPDPCKGGKCIEKEPWQVLAARNGFSTLQELMDYLTRLSPIGGLDSLRRIVDAAGGPDSVKLKSKEIYRKSYFYRIPVPPISKRTWQ